MKTKPRAGAPQLPATPGTYALVLHCHRAQTLAVGRLGAARFPRGYYVYVGSALGAGGLRARVGRHLAVPREPYWHVDYLRAQVRITEVWYATGPKRREHVWARALLQAADGWVEGFGASDCRCPTHLFRFFRKSDVMLALAGVGPRQRLLRVNPGDAY